MITVVAIALAPVFFVILLGYSAGKWRIVDNQNIGALNTVVMSYALPCSLFVATATTPRASMIGQWPLLAFAVGDAIGAPLPLLKLGVLLAALPSGFFGILFGKAYGVDSPESESIVVARVFSAITLAVVIAWLYG